MKLPFRKNSGSIKLRTKKILATLLSFVALEAPASDQMRVFGIPLGSAPDNPIQICDSSLKEHKVLCWFERPSPKKDKIFGLLVPTTNLPNWAAYNSFEVQLNEKGNIVYIISSSNSKNFDLNEIKDSLAKRFGNPSVNNLNYSKTRVWRSAQWRLPQIYISIEATDNYHKVIFSTPQFIAQMSADYEKSQRVSRPVSP
jgi:hypothetical protein